MTYLYTQAIRTAFADKRYGAFQTTNPILAVEAVAAV